MRTIQTICLMVFLFVAQSVRAVEFPCWDKPACYKEASQKPAFGLGIVEMRPKWHKELDDLSPRMRQDADYSILFDSQKDRIPYIHTEDSQRAVDEFAGDVISSIVSPLTYRLPFFLDFEKRRVMINAAIKDAMPEMRNEYYSVHFLPRVDFSRTNPVSLDIKVRDGRELGTLSLRIRETEIVAPVYRGVAVVGGYSFRDHSWYAYVAGKIPFPW